MWNDAEWENWEGVSGAGRGDYVRRTAMNILVLGGTGYLGGNIVHRLAREGHRLLCVIRNTSDTSRIEGIESVTFISNDKDEIEIAFRHSCIDWVINSVCTYKANNTLYGDMLSSNILFPLEVLNLAVKYGVKNFITIGTSLPQDINLYSFTKHKYSEFGKFLCETDDINFADLKLEMFYGGLFEPDNRFISSCIKKMKNDESVSLTEGSQKRDIVCVEDVVSIISRLITSGYLKHYMRLPVGSGESHSIVEIMKFMKEEMKSNSELKFGDIPSREGEPDTLADVSWYKDIGYTLEYGFFDGLRKECSMKKAGD